MIFLNEELSMSDDLSTSLSSSWTVVIPLDEPIPSWLNYHCDSKYIGYGWTDRFSLCQF